MRRSSKRCIAHHRCLHLSSISGQDIPFTFNELAGGAGLGLDLRGLIERIVGAKVWSRWGPVLDAIQADSHVPRQFVAALNYATELAGVQRLRTELRQDLRDSFEAEFSSFQDKLSLQARKRTRLQESDSDVTEGSAGARSEP